MMSRRRQTTYTTGCYQYSPPMRHRVNVEPQEKNENKKSMTYATTTSSASNTAKMGNGNKKSTSNSHYINDDNLESLTNITAKDIAKWSSSEVKNWIKQQCKKFELKKTTTDQFEMNGQALVLLTKHDFLRRSPDGGEVLYYALQRLINPNKVNSTSIDQKPLGNGSTNQHPRIVEINPDNSEHNDLSNQSSPKPIIEEPDDPPKIQKSHSDTEYTNQNHHRHHHGHPFFYSQTHMSTPVFTMPIGSAASYFQQHAHPHSHLHMHNQQQYFYPYYFQHYHPMMSAQGILIEIMDDGDFNNHTSNVPNDGMNAGVGIGQEQLFMVTINGQRYIMNEGQVIQLVTEVYQRQTYQENLQRQQQFQQQQRFHQQQRFRHAQQPPPPPQQQQQQQQYF